MKKISKIFAILSVFIIVFSSFSFTVNASNVTYSASSVSGAKGDTVTVNVKISSDVEIWGANVMLAYNSSELQFVSVSKGDAVSSGSLNNTGSSVNFSGMFSKKGGTVFSVKFKILKNSGKSTLSLTSTENIDYDGKTYNCSTSNGSVTVITSVTGITLNKTSVTLKKGETSQLSATVSPNDATDKTVSYSSSNKNVVTVDSNGKVTAVGGGTATITAKAGGKSASCKVTVTVSQTGIKVSGNSSRNIEIGDSLKLSVAKVPADATDNYSTSWSSSNPSIATVSSNGTVTAVSVGTVQITAKSNNWTAVYTISVTEKTEESTSEEASTGESATEEYTTEPIVTEPQTEELVITEPAIPDKDTVDEENVISETQLYLMMTATAVVVAVVTGTVTFFVTKGYYSIKNRKKDNAEDNF